VVTTVSDHIAEIELFVEKIVNNGYAYIGSNTKSVYFDVGKYEQYYGRFPQSQNGTVPPNPI
jgi:cysteinyl-tRNA synthetase